MSTHPLIERLRAARVVPVVRTSSALLAATAVAWLRDAGLRIFEITMTIPDARPNRAVQTIPYRSYEP